MYSTSRFTGSEGFRVEGLGFRVESPLIWVGRIGTLFITPLVFTHEPPSRGV